MAAPVASWIVASLPARRRLLHAALQHMNAARPPPGWTTEIVVGIEAGDVDTRRVCDEHGARIVEVKSPGGGPKRNAAIIASKGALMLIADDDDMVAPTRAELAVAAFTLGYKVTSSREFRYLHLKSGLVVRWRGRPQTAIGGIAPIVGAVRNIARTTVVGAGCYKDVPSLLETELQSRIVHRFREQDIDLSAIKALASLDVSSIWTQTINVQHGTNVWRDRQEPAKGETVVRGRYVLEGEGHWSEIADFPVSVVTALELKRP